MPRSSFRGRQERERFAREMGFEFQAEGESRWPELRELPAIRNLVSVANILSRQAGGLETAIMDVTSKLGKHSTTYTVACYRVAGRDLPSFALEPEDSLMKLLAALGYQDIDFGKDDEFSRRYVLRGEHEAHVRRLFTPSVRRFFERNPGLLERGMSARRRSIVWGGWHLGSIRDDAAAVRLVVLGPVRDRSHPRRVARM